jgi:hypothetical protein
VTAAFSSADDEASRRVTVQTSIPSLSSSTTPIKPTWNTLASDASRIISPIVLTSVVTAPAGQPSTIIVTTTPAAHPPQPMSSDQPPKQSPSTAGQLAASLGVGHNVEADIEGTVYRLPAPGQDAVELLLVDGTLAILLADKIVVDGQEVQVPSDLSSAQAILQGGHPVRVQPGTSTKPDDKGDEGRGGGIFGALTGIAGGIAGGAAGAVGASITGAAVGAKAFAGGAAPGTLIAPLSSAAGGLNHVVSSLHGVQEAFPSTQLSQTGVDVFSNALNLGQQCFDKMASLQALVPKFDNLSGDTQAKVRKSAEGLGDLLDRVCTLKYLLLSMCCVYTRYPRSFHAYRVCGSTPQAVSRLFINMFLICPDGKGYESV